MAGSSTPFCGTSRRCGRSRVLCSVMTVSRTDYYHEDGAPAATNLVPAASVVAVNEVGEILLHKRSDSGHWSIPGGKQEPGETIKETAVREAREETGYEVEVHGLVGIFSDP